MKLFTKDIPDDIAYFINNKEYSMDNIGMSGAKVICFGDMYLKISKDISELDREHKIMKWLDGKLPVPQCKCYIEKNEYGYLLMSKADGEMACSEKYMKNSSELADILSDGIKLLWGVKTKDCPFRNTVDEKIYEAEKLILNGQCSMENVEEGTYGESGFKDPKDLLKWLKRNKPKPDLVFSHGDYCLPNIFINNNKVSCFIDLGNCGIADRYQDIALCYRSFKHNFNGKYGREPMPADANRLFTRLGICPDWDKINYYILLDELF